MKKYLHFIIDEKAEHLFPLANLICVKVNFNMIDILYKESESSSYRLTIIAKDADNKKEILNGITQGILELQDELKCIAVLKINSGESNERNYIH